MKRKDDKLTAKKIISETKQYFIPGYFFYPRPSQVHTSEYVWGG